MASKKTILGLWLFFSALAFGAPAPAAVQMESLAVGYSSLAGHHTPLRMRNG
jgi:hypothetical protein